MYLGDQYIECISYKTIKKIIISIYTYTTANVMWSCFEIIWLMMVTSNTYLYLVLKFLSYFCMKPKRDSGFNVGHNIHKKRFH